MTESTNENISESVLDLIELTYDLDKKVSQFVREHGNALKEDGVYWHAGIVRDGISGVRDRFQSLHYDLWVNRKAGEYS